MSQQLPIVLLIMFLSSCASPKSELRGWGQAGGYERTMYLCADGSVSSRCPLR